MQYANAKATNYNVRIDLSRISSAGEQEIRILSTNSSTYGTVSSIQPSTVTIDVEEYITRFRIPVSVQTVGSAPEGYYAGAATLARRWRIRCWTRTTTRLKATCLK